MKYHVVYRRAYNDDGSLFFPERLTHEFLENAKRTMGSWLFANQYLNEIIPADKQAFKREFFRYYEELPKNVRTFIFIDPALSETATADSTGVIVVSVDLNKDWYIQFARRFRGSPTDLIEYIFKINNVFKPSVIGIEEVAYQKALLYFLDEEMRRRDIILPIKGIKPPTDKTKEMRILSLQPRFEYNHIFMKQGMADLEMELLKFPRGAHDDLIDALAGIEYIAYPPEPEKPWAKKPAPNHPDYESWYRQNAMNKGDFQDEQY